MIRMMCFTMMIAMAATLFTAENIPFIQIKQVATSQIPGDMLIPDLGSVVVDAKGNVFGFSGKNNGKECCVIKWDQNLRFIKKFSRQGTGPSEISMNFWGPEERLSIDPSNGDLMVIDYNPSKLVIFDNDGNYKTDIYPLRISPSLGITDMQSLGNQFYIGFKSNRQTFSRECRLIHLNPLEDRVLYDFNDKPIFIDMNSQYSSNVYGSSCYIDTDSGYCVIANSQFYMFQVFDTQGNKKLEVRDKTKKMGTFSTKEMEYIKKKDFPPDQEENESRVNKLLDLIKDNKNPIQNIRIGGNRIYLFLVNEDITVENKIPTVIYDLKGHVVKKTYFNKIPTKIWKQFAYYTELDDEDNPIVLKYQILDKY